MKQKKNVWSNKKRREEQRGRQENGGLFITQDFGFTNENKLSEIVFLIIQTYVEKYEM